MGQFSLTNCWLTGVGAKDFFCGGYHFHINVTKQPDFVSHEQLVESTRVNRETGHVTFNNETSNSVFFERRENYGGETEIDDILVLGSLLTANNWALSDRKLKNSFPCFPFLHFIPLCKDYDDLGEVLGLCYKQITDRKWQIQFANGFHIVMAYHNATIINTEARFLNNVIVWEALYPFLKNPKGATEVDESDNLETIFKYILCWFSESEPSDKGIIFLRLLRNQLAHSGRLPINRKGAERWMNEIDFGGTYRFFDRLTQAIVLKTLGVRIEDRWNHFDFPNHLQSFISHGKIRGRV